MTKVVSARVRALDMLALDTGVAERLLAERDARVVEPWQAMVTDLLPYLPAVKRRRGSRNSPDYDERMLRRDAEVYDPTGEVRTMLRARALLGGSGAQEANDA